MSDAIRPFTISVSDDELADLRSRLDRIRWPESEPVEDWTQGTPLSYTRELCDYWRNDYDWRRFESQLNAYDHFLTEIDEVDIHFMHIRSPARRRHAHGAHARLAGVGRRIHGRDRPVDEPDGARWSR